MKYQAIIFDLDGTLLNTLEDLADSVNHVLKENDFPLRTLEEVRCFVGNGIRNLIERSVPQKTSIEIIDKVYQEFITYYKTHCMEKTKPYDGILTLLNNLKKSGCKTAVVSNKANYAVQILCEKYFNNLLDISFGEQEGIPKKPAPDLVYKALNTLHINPENAVYIGDSDVDIITARNANMEEIIVNWGFRDTDFLKNYGAKIIVSSPKEIEEIILEN